jgi:hypothetical protein
MPTPKLPVIFFSALVNFSIYHIPRQVIRRRWRLDALKSGLPRRSASVAEVYTPADADSESFEKMLRGFAVAAGQTAPAARMRPA